MKTWIKFLVLSGGIAFIIVLSFLAGMNKKESNGNSIILQGLICHRGGAGLPENTLTAFMDAVDKGYKILETDIKITSDAIPVLLHDMTINRTSNGAGSVDAYTLRELESFDFGNWFSESCAGEKIVTLDTFLEFCRKNAVFAELDLVNEAITIENLTRVYDIVKNKDMKKNTIFTVSCEQASELVNIDPNLIICISGIRNIDTAQKALNLKEQSSILIYSVPYDFYTTELLTYCHDNNVLIKLWTVNDVEIVKNLLNERVDLIITDDVKPADIDIIK